MGAAVGGGEAAALGIGDGKPHSADIADQHNLLQAVDATGADRLAERDRSVQPHLVMLVVLVRFIREKT